MVRELRLPDIGEGLTEAEIVSWLAAVGDEITANQPIVEIETAKAVVEISPPRGGFLLHQGAGVGETVAVGELLAVIGERDEQWGATSPVAPAATDESAVAASVETPAAPAARPRAVPLIRKLAKDLGVDLTKVTGTGANGQITRADVKAATEAVIPSGGRSGATEAEGVTAAGGGEPRRLSATRRAIAANLTRSWTEIPHVTVWGPADATSLLAARSERGGPLEAYLIRAVVPVLVEFPDFNANFDGETITPAVPHSIGIAVDTPAGLVVPVVTDVGRPDLEDEIGRLVDAAVSRRLRPEDMQGATFTISNVGAVGGGYGTPVIPHGTTAVVSVGWARDDVVVRDGGIHVAPVFPVALSFDHRVIDGALGSRFLNRFVESLESYPGSG